MPMPTPTRSLVATLLDPTTLDWLRSLSDLDFQIWLLNISHRDKILAADIRRRVGRERVEDYSGYTTDEIAALFGVSQDAVETWQQRGLPIQNRSETKGGGRNYNLADCAKWVARQKRRGAASHEKAKAEQLLRDEQIRIKELQRRKMEGELVEASYYQQRLVEAVSVIRKGMEMLQRTYGDGLVEEIDAIVDESIRVMFGEDSSE